MNREIKFRAYHNKAQKMLESGTSRQIFSWQDEGQDITIMQYTGLRDKNGKEIYEGDVVSCFNDTKDPYFIHEVVYDNGAFCYKVVIENSTNVSFQDNYYFNWENGMSNKIEVIGNIYETPELLNNVLNVQGSDTTDDASSNQS